MPASSPLLAEQLCYPRALPVMVSRSPPNGDFRTNHSIGGHFAPTPWTNFLACSSWPRLAVLALRREFTAVDIRMKGDQAMILEVNRQPDFEGFERATHFDVASEVVRYIRERVGRR